jgi:hypothetical protein
LIDHRSKNLRIFSLGLSACCWSALSYCAAQLAAIEPISGTPEKPSTVRVTTARDALLTQPAKLFSPANKDTRYWDLALEFSTFYLTSRFTPGKLTKEDPLNQLVPLVEFSFDSPRGKRLQRR